MNVYPRSDPICVSYRRISLLTVSMPGVLSLTPRSVLTSGPEGLSTSSLAVERLSSRAGPLLRALIAEGPASEGRLAHDEPWPIALKTVSIVMRGETWELCGRDTTQRVPGPCRSRIRVYVTWSFVP